MTWNVCVLHRGDSPFPEDARTWEIVEGLRAISGEINVNEVLPMGRALESFAAHYPRRPGLPTGPCPARASGRPWFRPPCSR